MPFTRDTARQAGQKSGIARRDKPKEALSLERVQQELGRLEPIEDAQRRLDLIGVWSLAGMLPGAVAEDPTSRRILLTLTSFAARRAPPPPHHPT